MALGTWGTWGTYSRPILRVRAHARVCKGRKMFPMFPMFPSARVFNGLGRGTSVFDVPLQRPMFPNLRLIGTGRWCFGLTKLEFPPRRLVLDACLPNPDTDLSNPEHTVAHSRDRLAERRLLGTIRSPADWQSRVAEQSDIKQICREDRGRPEPLPPGSDERTPAGALAVGRRHHLLEIAEETWECRLSRARRR
jgi:hypothetical protein